MLLVTITAPHPGILHGVAGDSAELRLENAKNNFERGRTDVFEVDAPDLGDLKAITIGHDNKVCRCSTCHGDPMESLQLLTNMLIVGRICWLVFRVGLGRLGLRWQALYCSRGALVR